MRMNDLRSQLKWYSCEGTRIGAYPLSLNESYLWKSGGDSCRTVYNSTYMEEIRHFSIYACKPRSQDSKICKNFSRKIGLGKNDTRTPVF